VELFVLTELKGKRMTGKQRGGDLFIVDNSVSGWTGLSYLQECSELAKSFDFATGYFEIGSLLELDGKWQHLEKIPILMGDETSRRTRAALLEAIKTKADKHLDGSIEDEKELLAELDGVDVVIAAAGDELLANPGDLLIPCDEAFVYGAYPQMVDDLDGTMVPIVTTSGEYHYVGKLVVGFDKNSEVIEIRKDLSGPVWQAR